MQRVKCSMLNSHQINYKPFILSTYLIFLPLIVKCGISLRYFTVDVRPH